MGELTIAIGCSVVGDLRGLEIMEESTGSWLASLLQKNKIKKFSSWLLGSQYLRDKCWVKRKVYLFRKLAAWEDGRLMSKDRFRIFRPSRRILKGREGEREF